MGVNKRTVTDYICDRCGDDEHRNDNIVGPWNTYRRIIHGGTNNDDERNRTTWLCGDCYTWLNKFLQGRKVEA